MTTSVQAENTDRYVHEFFLISVLLKGAISLAEVIVGIAVLLIPPQTIVFYTLWVLNYLPNAALQSKLIGEVSQFTSSTAVFVALYLLSRGLIKVALVWGLLKRKYTAYPLSLLVLAVLVCYQIYQLTLPPLSLIVLGITLFDLVVMYFIYKEWGLVQKYPSTTLG